ncbi:MAG: chemotaxis protein CheD [Candidatus Krumholzibacteriota bacterium]|nr:chemotaxis protein CheD [Candidatus Krumholzibacteriota bacterium]
MDFVEATLSKHTFVAIGQVITKRAPEKLASVLGSCVALTLYDPLSKTGGMAHILLSGGGNEDSTRYSVPAVRRLVSEVQELAGEKAVLIAKVVGGAYTGSPEKSSLLRNIGRNTVLKIVTMLTELEIDIEGMHTGGFNERIILFDLDSGDITVNTNLANTHIRII